MIKHQGLIKRKRRLIQEWGREFHKEGAECKVVCLVIYYKGQVIGDVNKARTR